MQLRPRGAAASATTVHRLLGDGHRHRHPEGQAEAHLRGVPAGGRHHQPQVRRHRPGPVDQPRDRPPARRRDRGRERRRARAAPSPSTCRDSYVGPARRTPSADAAGAAAPCERRRRPPREPASRVAGCTAPPPRRELRRRSAAPTSWLRADRGRPRAHPRGRPGAAHHRGRREVRPHHAAAWRARRASRRWWPPAATPAWRWPTSYQPDAITLDIQLPVVDGWSVLDRLKRNPRTRHIPVHIISRRWTSSQRGARMGAFAYLEKPVSKEALEGALRAHRAASSTEGEAAAAGGGRRRAARAASSSCSARATT